MSCHHETPLTRQQVHEEMVGESVAKVVFVEDHALRIVLRDGTELHVAAYEKGDKAIATRLEAVLVRPERIRHQVVSE